MNHFDAPLDPETEIGGHSPPPCQPRVDALGFLGDVGPPSFDGLTRENVARSGVRLIHVTSTWPMQLWEDTLAMHRKTVQDFEAHLDFYRIVRCGEDLDSLAESGKVGILFGMQDPGCIGDRLDRIDLLFEEGVRVLQVAYQRRNLYGSGFIAEAEDSGLSETGRAFVRRANDRGMILDLSHLSPKTALDCLDNAPGPLFISHTTARGVYDHPRGSTDEVLRAMACRSATFVGALAMTFFLDPIDNGLAPFVRHLRHMADIMGTHRVGVGSDGPVGGFTDPRAAERVFREQTQKLMDPDGRLKSRWPTHIPEVFHAAGGLQRMENALAGQFRTEEIPGILGGNAWRFLRCLFSPDRPHALSRPAIEPPGSRQR